MTPRLLVSIGGVTALIAIMVLATPPLSAQGPLVGANKKEGAAKTYSPPRTPDGQPDLQGFWTNAGYAPLERPDTAVFRHHTAQSMIARRLAAAAVGATRRRASPGVARSREKPLNPREPRTRRSRCPAV